MLTKKNTKNWHQKNNHTPKTGNAKGMAKQQQKNKHKNKPSEFSNTTPSAGNPATGTPGTAP